MTPAEAVAASAARLRGRCGGEAPEVAVLLGSGWGGAVGRTRVEARLPYAELPAFPAVTVAGHAGEVVVGALAGRRVLLLSGRAHAYERGDAGAMAGAVRSLAAAGVRLLLQTNAAGSLDPSLPPGTVLLVADHLNLPQRSPLVGLEGPDRFLDLGAAYDPRLRERARRAAEAAGLALPEGVYAWVLGPQFETPAEVRMLRLLGARAVGMSTVPETLLARHAGLRVLALSLLTNLGAGLAEGTLSHAHTLAAAQASSAQALAVLEAVVGGLGDLAPQAVP